MDQPRRSRRLIQTNLDLAKHRLRQTPINPPLDRDNFRTNKIMLRVSR